MPNASEADMKNAIDELGQYQKKLIEIADTMQTAVRQTEQNLQGDDNVKAVNAALKKRIIKIHEASMQAKDIALNISMELEEMRKANRMIYDHD